MIHKFIYSALLLFITGFHSFSQSKKEQIEVMTLRLDSLNNVLQNQKTVNSQLASTNTNLTLKIDSLEALNNSLNQDNSGLIFRVDSLNTDIANYTNTIDSLSGLLLQEDSPFERRIEIYENCVPQEVYSKSDCSHLELEYDIVQSQLLSEENEEVVNKLIQLLLFNYNFSSPSLEYSKIKREKIKDFITNADEYYVEDMRMVYCGFLSPKLVCLDHYLSEYNEGAPHAEVGQEHLIYNLAKKKVMKFNDVFLPNSENQLEQILVNHINQLVTLDEYEGREDLANSLPESGNIDDFGFDLAGFFISSQCEGLLSGQLIKANGFGFYFGRPFFSLPSGRITIPFSECAHLLKPDFLALIK
jgi:hypothetical protein